jgi:hypothetical protein
MGMSGTFPRLGYCYPHRAIGFKFVFMMANQDNPAETDCSFDWFTEVNSSVKSRN